MKSLEALKIPIETYNVMLLPLFVSKLDHKFIINYYQQRKLLFSILLTNLI